ncbi:MAG: dynamin family protein, partial [Deltaproteobacteria bacterium]|nr:dynamin family protein [Deltaproteobacteria bacterium]
MAKPLIEYLRQASALAERLDSAPLEDAAVNGKAGEASSGDALDPLSKIFDKMIQKLEDKDVSVGLIGITSCGKSSVINAIMGHDLLVHRVRPSSNIVVNCRKDSGDRVRAEIIFAGKPSQLFEVGGHGARNDKELAELIGRYSDESENANNRLGVDFIKIWTPEFRLGDDVTVADTPGLKAYAYQEHEELTWAFMGPQVDVAIFLCTAKSESDADNRKYLEMLRDFGDKDIVVVQNMRDSVMPELDVKGRERRSREQNLQILEKRLRRLVAGVFEGRPCPPIFQISAKEASDKAKYASSGFPELIDCLNVMVRKSRDTLELKRGRTFVKKLRKRMPSGGDVEVEKELLEENEAEIEEAARLLKVTTVEFEDFNKRFEGIKSDVDRNVARFRAPGTFRSNLDQDRARELLEEFNSFVKTSYVKIIKLVKEISGKATAVASCLDLEDKEFRNKHKQNAPTRESLRVPTNEELRYRRTQQSGFGGSVKRFFGNIFGGDDWGYVDDSYTVFVV